MSARILDVDPTEYHKLPGFSASIAKVIVARCELVARDAYQRQMERAAEQDADEDDDADETPSDDARVAPDKQKRLDRGDILHALLLRKGKRIEVIPASKLGKNGAYNTAASKALRDGARAAGRIPVKETDIEMYERTAAAIRARLESAGHVFDGTSELAIEWHEPGPHGDVQCRAMLDHVLLFASDGMPVTPGEPPVTIKPATATIYDLKFCGDASPDRSQRTAESLGYAIQAAAYMRALNALYRSLAGRIEFRFLFCEPHRPYAFWDPPPSGAFREIGERRWRRALNAWGEGLATGRWPDYRTPEHCELTCPMYVLKAEGYQPEDF